MQIDWDGALEVTVWSKGRHPTADWTDVIRIRKTGFSPVVCYWVYYIAADGTECHWSATQHDGKMYGIAEHFGQVRNKK